MFLTIPLSFPLQDAAPPHWGQAWSYAFTLLPPVQDAAPPHWGQAWSEQHHGVSHMDVDGGPRSPIRDTPLSPPPEDGGGGGTAWRGTVWRGKVWTGINHVRVSCLTPLLLCHHCSLVSPGRCLCRWGHARSLPYYTRVAARTQQWRTGCSFFCLEELWARWSCRAARGGCGRGQGRREPQCGGSSRASGEPAAPWLVVPSSALPCLLSPRLDVPCGENLVAHLPTLQG